MRHFSDIVPFVGRFHGREQVAKKFFAGLAQSLKVEKFEVNTYVAQGDRVVVLGHYRWQVKGTGRQFECDFAHVITMRNGKEIAFQEYTDSYAVADAFQPVHAHAH